MRFAIFTHVQHKSRHGQYYAYAPYVREMNLWFKQVEEVEIIAPISPRSTGPAEIPYRHDNLIFTKIPFFNLTSWYGALRALFVIPQICFAVFKGMHRADHLHLRCPGNVGLLACVLQVFFPNKTKTAKYAGNWDPQASQPWSYNLQKWILASTFLTRNMQVLVYGEWPAQSTNIKEFFTASFSEDLISEVKEKSFTPPFKFLFVGNLVPGKQPIAAVELIENLRGKGVQVSLDIFGDGVLREKLEKSTEKLDYIELKGARSLEELHQGYQEADFVILPSQSEGWPKALAEGMFFGCLPIGTPVSCVPWMLDNGERGILLDQEEQLERVTENIFTLLKDPTELQRRSGAAKAWSQQYTTEKFETEIKSLLFSEKKSRKTSQRTTEKELNQPQGISEPNKSK